MKLSYLLLMVSLVLLAPRDVTAQRPDYGSVLDSILQSADPELLRRTERALPLPRAAGDVEPLVRRGLLGLRLYALGQDRADAERARATFEVAAERFPAEPWSHYGLALAFAHGPDARLPLLGDVLPSVTLAQTVAEIFGRDAAARARRALRRALELDPAFGRAAVLLADLALADGRSRDQLLEARAALLASRGAGGVARALSDVETALGNYGAAAAAAGAGGRDAASLRSRGIALMLQPDSVAAGYDHYRQGLAALDANAAELYYQDLAVLVNAQEAAEWRSAATPAQQRLWLERFWDRRAAEGAVTPAERVAEHYARLSTARERYVTNARRGSEHQTGGALLADEPVEDHVFDDRGVVLIRHGRPARAVRTTANGVLPNETWAYRMPGQDGYQLFHFVALRGARDYSLVPDVLRAVEPEVLRVEKLLRGIRPSVADGLRRSNFDRNTQTELDRRERAVMSLIEDRADLEPRYRQGAARLRQLLQAGRPLDGTEVRSILERADADYRQSARRALRTDTHQRTWAEALAFHSDVFTFRTPFARTDVTAAFAVPTRQLEAVAGSGGREYVLDLSLILTDTLQDLVTRIDTTRTVRVASADEPFVRTHVTMPVVPSEHTTFRLVASDAVGNAGAVEEGSVRLRDYAGSRLQLSDVVLALPDSAGDWQRGPVELALLLPRSFGPDRPFTVFYEIYNLPADAAYVTEVTVTPAGGRGLLGRIFGGGRDRIRLRFEGVAKPGADGVVQEIRELAGDLPAGRYRLEIEVTHRVTGESAGTATEFTVLD